VNPPLNREMRRSKSFKRQVRQRQAGKGKYVNLVGAKERSLDDCSMVMTCEKPKVPRDVYKIQAVNALAYDRYKKHSDTIKRNSLGKDGQWALLSGTIVDVRFGFTCPKSNVFYKNVATSICLSHPKKLGKKDKVIDVGDHLWLHLDNSLMPLPEQKGKVELALHIGELLIFDGEVKTYSNNRKGIGQWRPFFSKLRYGQVKDSPHKHPTIKTVPDYFKRKALIMQWEYERDPNQNGFRLAIDKVKDGRTLTVFVNLKDEIEKDVEYLNELFDEYIAEQESADRIAKAVK